MLLFAALDGAEPLRCRVTIDDCLLSGVAEGSPQAFSALYRMAAQPVYAYALSILKDPIAAEDAMQDTFLKVRSAAHLYEARGKAMAWILTITRNVCLMELRQRRHLASFQPEEDRQADFSQIQDLEDRMVIRSALRVLSDQECQIITLHAVTGWKHREIAALLGLPLPTVISKYRRGLNKLKAELEGKL